MAINLRKEAYHKEQSADSTEKPGTVREVFPTYNGPPYIGGNIGEDGEIYPVKEIYPQAPPKINIRTEEETAVEAPAENLPTAPRTKRNPKKAAVLCLALGMVILSAVTVFGITANDNSSKYSCYRTACNNIYSSEGIGEVIIKGDNANLTVEYGETGCDIEFGTITGNEAVMTKIPRDSESTAILIDFTCIEIKDAYCAKDPSDVTLTLPKNYKGSVKLIGRNTQISCTGAASVGAADFYCQSGDITINCVTSDNITLMTDKGNISVSNSTANALEVSSSDSGLTLSNVTAAGGAKLSTNYGSIHLNDTQFIGGTDIQTAGGNIFGNNTEFKGKASVTAENSYIQLNYASFGDMSVTNGNGDIIISSDCKRSDYTVAAETDSGDCNIQNGGNGQYTLKVRTTGNIDISFDDSDSN